MWIKEDGAEFEKKRRLMYKFGEMQFKYCGIINSFNPLAEVTKHVSC